MLVAVGGLLACCCAPPSSPCSHATRFSGSLFEYCRPASADNQEHARGLTRHPVDSPCWSDAHRTSRRTMRSCEYQCTEQMQSSRRRHQRRRPLNYEASRPHHTSLQLDTDGFLSPRPEYRNLHPLRQPTGITLHPTLARQKLDRDRVWKVLDSLNGGLDFTSIYALRDTTPICRDRNPCSGHAYRCNTEVASPSRAT